ncbi:MAG: dipeptidase [Bacteroidetes bacterium]|jgi:membrane dipeptidase|nr:dipeptidase [Bacteroidota bacterium]
MKRFLGLLLLLAVAVVDAQPADPVLTRARQLAQQYIIIDGHVDAPYRIREKWEDLSKSAPGGEFDYPRARVGGLDAPFMAIYVPSEKEDRGAKALADTLIMGVENMAKWHPDKFALATTPAHIRANAAKGLISLPMGMENGSPIERKLENVRYFADRGVRYITLAHAKANHISDAAYDTTRPWGGLSPFGEEVVREMNRWSIMVDVSHLTDAAVDDCLRVSRSPVIASHSSCRAFTPGFERNLSDELIKAIAANGGVVMVNFGSSFLTATFQEYEESARREVMRLLRSKGLRFTDPRAQEIIKEYQRQHPTPYAMVSDVADHIDHIVRMTSIDHVGIGSDFDGVGDSLPIGLKSVADYPNLIAELLRRQYSEEDIKKICGENLLRVWEQNETVAKRMQGEGE